MNLLIAIIIVLLLFGGIGAPGLGPWNHGLGWYPSGGAGLLVLVLLIVLLTGRG